MSNPNNNVNLIGHIISEPQFLRTHQNIEFATRFLLSVKKGYKTAEGKDSRDVIPVRIRGEKRMPFAHMLKKGDHICLNGVVSSESYQSKDGTKMFSLCIEAQNVNWTYGNTKSERKKGKIPDAPKEEEKENCCIEFDFDLSELPFS
ncbi:MAG: single-stranded DNA-binding protein [Ruminococcus sp.]